MSSLRLDVNTLDISNANGDIPTLQICYSRQSSRAMHTVFALKSQLAQSVYIDKNLAVREIAYLPELFLDIDILKTKFIFAPIKKFKRIVSRLKTSFSLSVYNEGSVSVNTPLATRLKQFFSINAPTITATASTSLETVSLISTLKKGVTYLLNAIEYRFAKAIGIKQNESITIQTVLAKCFKLTRVIFLFLLSAILKPVFSIATQSVLLFFPSLPSLKIFLNSISLDFEDRVGHRISIGSLLRLAIICGYAVAVERIDLLFSKKVGIKYFIQSIYATVIINPSHKLFVLIKLLTALKSAFVNTSKVLGSKTIVDIPGANMTEIVYNLIHNTGSTAVAQSPVEGRTDWQAITNAQGSASNTNNATISGNLLSAIAGRLDFDFNDFVGKEDLAITKVELHFYVQQAGVLLGGGTMKLQMSKSASIINLQDVTGNTSNLTTPIVIDITSNISSWSDLNALKAHVVFNNPLGRVSTAAVNAIHLNVLAAQTQIL